MTAIMEGALSKIAAGELTLDAFMNWQVDWLSKLIETIESLEISIDKFTFWFIKVTFARPEKSFFSFNSS
jgi:DNA topoisomerase IA